MSIRLWLPSVVSCLQSNNRIPPPIPVKRISHRPGENLRVESESCIEVLKQCLSPSSLLSFLFAVVVFSLLFFFPMFPFCPHHLLPLWQQNLHHPCFHSNRLPWKLGDSAAHPILLSLCKKCSERESLFCPSLVYKK